MAAERPNALSDDLKKLATMYSKRGKSEEAKNTLLLANEIRSEQDAITHESAFITQSDKQNNDQLQA